MARQDVGLVQEEIVEPSESEDESEDEAVLATSFVNVEPSVYYDVVLTCSMYSQCDRVAGSLFFCVLSILCALTMSVVFLPEIAQDGLLEKVEPENLFGDWAADLDGGARPSQDGNTWVYWACEGSDLSWHSSTFGDYKGYVAPSFIGGIMKGELFGVMAILLWIAMAAKELKAIVGYLLILGLPVGSVGRCYRHGRDGSRLVAVPLYVKIIIVIVAICRLVIMIALGWYGVKFLSYTENLKDFILNSVALGFIYDIDELIFNVFIADSKKRHVSSLKDGCVPVPTAKWVVFIYDRLNEFIGMALLVVGVFLSWYFLLGPFADRVWQDAYCHVCKNATVCK